MPRVLVIDDQLHVRATICVMLKALGFDVVAAENGRSGLSKLDSLPFDLAIVDIYMLEMDGVKFIKAVRERIPNLPIIGISGVLLPGSSGRTVLDILPLAPDLAGVTCLQKPFRSNELLQAIQKTIGVAAPQ